MANRKKFSYKKFEDDRDKATKLSKSGFRLDTLSDDLHRTVKAIQKVRDNVEFMSNDEYCKLEELAKSCDKKSACEWCTLHVTKRIKLECKVCLNNT